MKFSFKDHRYISSNLYNKSVDKHFNCRCRALKCILINWIQHSYILPYKNTWSGYIRSVCVQFKFSLFRAKIMSEMILRTVFSSFLKCPRALTSHMWPGLFLHYTSRFSPGLPLDFSVTMFHLIFLPPCVPIFTFFSFHLHTPVLFTGFPITHALHPVFSCATSVFFPSRVPPTPVFSCVFLQSCFSTKNGRRNYEDKWQQYHKCKKQSKRQHHKPLNLWPFPKKEFPQSYCCSFNYLDKTCYIESWLNRPSN